MPEIDRIHTTTEETTPLFPPYSRWMIGVLMVFAVCEILFFVWGSDASVFARIGLVCMVLFAVLRLCGRSLVEFFFKRSCLGFYLAFVTLFIIGDSLAVMQPIPMILCGLGVPQRSECAYNFKQFGAALQNYYEERKTFPPAFVADETGQPIHSWRALLMPFFEKENYYSYEKYEYDATQPWNSPKNQDLAKDAPCIFRCHGVYEHTPEPPENRTDYLAVLGADTLWSLDGSSRSFETAPEKLSNVAIITEVRDSDIQPYEPRDITVDTLAFAKPSWSETAVHERQAAFSEPKEGRHALFADGTVRFLQSNLTPDQIQRLFSITNPFSTEELDAFCVPRPRIFRHIVFYIWLVTLLLQLVYIAFPVDMKNQLASDTKQKDNAAKEQQNHN